LKLDVACAAEGADYVAHSAAMLHSVLASNRDHEVHVHYMHGPDISEAVERQLAEMVELEGGQISFLRIGSERLEGLPSMDFSRRATWYRIFLPELRPELDRILYLDSDLIVRKSLAPLWNLDLSGVWVAAATNVFLEHQLYRPASLGLAGPDVYFNAGVLLMNLAEMRRDDRTRALLEYGVGNASQLEWWDQDALNVVLGERRLRLARSWNAMNAYRNPFTRNPLTRWQCLWALRRARVRHFEGPDENKPWHVSCQEPDRHLYWDHLRATPWRPIQAADA